MSLGPQNQKDLVTLTPGGIKKDTLSTAQRGTPIAYLAGTGNMPTHWLCSSYNPRQVEIPVTSTGTKGGSAKGADSGSGQYNNFGSIAGLLGHGPLTKLNHCKTDDEIVWTGPVDLTAVADPYPLTIPDIGAFDFRRGSYDQGDWGLPVFGDESLAHPYYRGMAGFKAKDILFGASREAPQNFTWNVSRQPVQSLITGPAALLDDGQCNPLVILAELITSPWCGLGAPVALVTQAAIQAAADIAYANRDLCYVSVLLTSRAAMKALAADLFVLFDGFWRVDRSTGGLEFGVFPKPETINAALLPYLTNRTGIDAPDLTADTWDDIKTRFVVNFTDRDADYGSDSVEHKDPRAKGGISQDRADTLDRPYITRRSQAINYAREYARRFALLGMRGTLLDRTPIVAGVRAGDHVLADTAPEPGDTEVDRIFRVQSVTRPSAGPTSLTVESERSIVPVVYTTPESSAPQTIAEVPAIDHAAFFELPPQLADGGEFAVGVLASRPAATVVNCAVYFDSNNDSNSTFPLLGKHPSYALRAELVTGVNDSVTSLVIHLLDPLNREIVASDPGPVASRNDDLLLILLHAPSAGQTLLEIVSCEAFVASGTDQLTISTLRGRCGTAPITHAASVSAWFIRRDALPWYRHADFSSRASGGAPCYFKLQPATYQASRSLEDCTTGSFTFDTVRAYAPAITLTAPASDPAGVEVNHALACTGIVTDADGNLTSVTVLRSQNGTEEVLLDKYFAPSRSMSFDLTAIPFPTEGSAAIVIRAQDSTLRTVEKRVNVIVGAAGSGGTVPTDRLLPPILLDSKIVPVPFFAAAPFYYGADLPLAGAPLEYSYPDAVILGWVKVRCPSIGTNSSLRVEHHAAASSIGASTPETDWVSIQATYDRDFYAGEDNHFDHRETQILYNFPGGACGYDITANGDGNNYIRPCIGLPRNESGIRIWVKAHDTAAVLGDSEIVYFDIYA